MEILSVFDPAFRAYGAVVTGMDEACAEVLSVLSEKPVTGGVVYVAEDPDLQELPAMIELSEHVYGGMPVQLGWCNGHNTKLNALEYHRDSEFNLGTDDFILLLAQRSEIEDDTLDTAKVKAFRVPAGVLVEVYATTLHYAPCHTDPEKGFRVLVILPQGTNTDLPELTKQSGEDRLLWARNKWLIAHPESDEAAQGAYTGLTGENIDIKNLI